MTNTKPIIRSMRASDLEEVAVLYTNIFAKVDIGEKWTNASAYQFMNHYHSKQPDLCFVAIMDDKIVGGFVAGIKPWWDGNHLVDGEVFVDFAYQKHKVGTELSRVMYNDAIEKYKITSIDFVTFSKDGFPLSWYEKLGFEVTKDLYMISGKPDLVLERLG